MALWKSRCQRRNSMCEIKLNALEISAGKSWIFVCSANSSGSTARKVLQEHDGKEWFSNITNLSRQLSNTSLQYALKDLVELCFNRFVTQVPFSSPCFYKHFQITCASPTPKLHFSFAQVLLVSKDS